MGIHSHHRQICVLPLVFDIKRHSLEDGPGIRSVVFFKGCPLRCDFCHNPEGQDPEREIAFSAEKCIGCGECARACPQAAIDLDLPGRIERGKCDRCGRCAEVCPGGGLRVIGTYYSVQDLAEILLRDLPYYRHSGGGVTVSGGECTLFPDYLESLLRTLKARDVHVVLETSGHFDYDAFSTKVLPHVDLIYFDIKIADPATHRTHTGRSNREILHNLRRLLQDSEVEVQPRVPLIPDITATRENLSAIVDLLCGAGADRVSLLPYNPLGLDMLPSLGKPGTDLPKQFADPDEDRAIYATFESIIEERRKSRTTVGSGV